MTARSPLPRVRAIVALLAAFLLLGSIAAYASSAPSPQLGSLSTVNLCVRKAGPEKGDVRFVQKRSYCKPGELRVRVLGDGSTQSALGLGETGGPPPVAAKPSAGGASGYLRVEAVSPDAAGVPESASASVTCPGGRRVLSGGYRVEAGEPAAGNNPAEIAVTESHATSDATWTVTAFADDAEDVGPWSVAAYAICAYIAA
jgi:hypothetical protein